MKEEFNINDLVIFNRQVYRITKKNKCYSLTSYDYKQNRYSYTQIAKDYHEFYLYNKKDNSVGDKPYRLDEIPLGTMIYNRDNSYLSYGPYLNNNKDSNYIEYTITNDESMRRYIVGEKLTLYTGPYPEEFE